MNPSTQTAGMPGAPRDGEAQQACEPVQLHGQGSDSADLSALALAGEALAYTAQLAIDIQFASRAAARAERTDEEEARSVRECVDLAQSVMAYLAARIDHIARGERRDAGCGDLAGWVLPPRLRRQLEQLERRVTQ